MARLLSCALLAAVTSIVACSASPEEGDATSAPVVETSPTEAAEEPAPAGPAPLAASPSCGAPGAHVILKVGNTPDGRKPNCLRIQDFSVRFGKRPTKILQAGDTYDGYCGLDVLVPEGAESGPVSVTSGKDVFESASAFLPCP